MSQDNSSSEKVSYLVNLHNKRIEEMTQLKRLWQSVVVKVKVNYFRNDSERIQIYPPVHLFTIHHSLTILYSIIFIYVLS